MMSYDTQLGETMSQHTLSIQKAMRLETPGGPMRAWSQQSKCRNVNSKKRTRRSIPSFTMQLMPRRKICMYETSD